MVKWVKAGQSYPSWNSKTNADFKKDAVIEGVVTEKQTGVGPNSSNIYVIERAGGDKMSVWGTTVLDRLFKSLPIGTLVKVTYHGLDKSKKGTSYHNYTVEYDQETLPDADITEAADEVFGK